MRIGECLFMGAANNRGHIVLTYAGVVVGKTLTQYLTRSIKNVEDKRIYRIFKWRRTERMSFLWANRYMLNSHPVNARCLGNFIKKSHEDLLSEGHYAGEVK